jgi:probable rRNA maturation factor
MTLALVVDDDVAIATPVRAKLRREVARMVRAAALHDRIADYEASLRLVGDAAIHELNRDYRRKDKPTDVLAFASREAPGAPRDLLGDIVISVDTARRQAKRGLYAELAMLASHGLCHLLGYDHDDDAEERVMNARMAALRAEARRRGRVRAA